jgi:hypothetical protein
MCGKLCDHVCSERGPQMVSKPEVLTYTWIFISFCFCLCELRVKLIRLCAPSRFLQVVLFSKPVNVFRARNWMVLSYPSVSTASVSVWNCYRLVNTSTPWVVKWREIQGRYFQLVVCGRYSTHSGCQCRPDRKYPKLPTCLPGGSRGRNLKLKATPGPQKQTETSHPSNDTYICLSAKLFALSIPSVKCNKVKNWWPSCVAP